MPRRWRTRPPPPSSGSRVPSAARSREARAVPCTSVARGLQTVAEEEDALAIVVGPSHRGALGQRRPRQRRRATAAQRALPRRRRAERLPVGGARRRSGASASASPPSPRRTRRSPPPSGIAARTGAAIHVLSVVEPPVRRGPRLRLGLRRARADRPRRPGRQPRQHGGRRRAPGSRSTARSSTATPTTSSPGCRPRSTCWSAARDAAARLVASCWAASRRA